MTSNGELEKPICLEIGRFAVHLLNDGYVWLDGGAMFGVVPKALWGRRVQADEQNRIELCLRCLLIEDGDNRVLVDTGVGRKLGEKEASIYRFDGRPGLLAQLDCINVNPESIGMVINTHLHHDHCGGNTTVVDGEVRPTFPSAIYWISEREYADASRPNERTKATYLSDNFAPLERSGQLKLFSGQIEPMPGLKLLPAPGHTAGQIVVLLEDAGQSLLFAADVAPLVPHLERIAWTTAFDTEPLATMETKRSLLRLAIEKRTLIVLDHDPKAAVVRITGDESQPQVEPVLFDKMTTPAG